ncbi:site-specific DNA-methyltransferase [Pseudoalteromonas sp. Of7M-16]|uniref:DNA-methyltransferase n=1 Tax=Pseudoalteromonas sp. Of7M-16 TaxID=2917756 RepID=UPI001EF5F724|nr:site-specific DNA-methyltransferase [Pseudoalteromonas sp. Of7M-16]MCG7551348.1 site-specific DNA-methyltransferase [Pseudoalteromonas sp. Of7M-16]
MKIIKHKDNTLVNGDALAYLRTLEDASIGALVTDNPYSSGGLHRSDRVQKTSTKYQGTGFKHLYPEFVGDNRDQLSQLAWMNLWLTDCYRVLEVGAFVLVFTDWRQLPLTCTAVQTAGFIQRGIVPWDKTQATRPQKGQFRPQCEYVVWGTKGGLSEAAKTRPPLPGCFTHSSQKGGKFHIAGKPVALMHDLIEIVPPGKSILDPFMGSGSTGLACEGRNPFVGVELTECNFAVACERFGISQEDIAC